MCGGATRSPRAEGRRDNGRTAPAAPRTTAPARERPHPSIVLEPVDGVAFGEDVPLRLPITVALVEPPQPVLDGAIRDLLQADVERRPDGETVFVQHLRAVLVLEVLADLLDEERRDARRLRRLAARHDRLLPWRARLPPRGGAP